MARIPREKSFDATVALLRDPYEFVSKRCRRYGSDLFQTRLMLRKTICMTGPESAELFYDQSRFMRQGATPGRIQKTLFGRGGVQGPADRPFAAFGSATKPFYHAQGPDGPVNGEAVRERGRKYCRMVPRPQGPRAGGVSR